MLWEDQNTAASLLRIFTLIPAPGLFLSRPTDGSELLVPGHGRATTVDCYFRKKAKNWQAVWIQLRRGKEKDFTQSKWWSCESWLFSFKPSPTSVFFFFSSCLQEHQHLKHQCGLKEKMDFHHMNCMHNFQIGNGMLLYSHTFTFIYSHEK